VTDDVSGFEEIPFDPASMPTSSLGIAKAVWYRRPWFLLTVALVVIVAVSVIVDLPGRMTPKADAASQNASIKEINTDLAECSFAVKESFSFYNEDVAGTLTASDLTQVPALLVGDQTACSFASQPVYDLTNNLQIDDTKAGIHINHMLTAVEQWITNNALAAIEDIQYLISHPGDAKKIHSLTAQETGLQFERTRALNDESAAEKILGLTLVPVKIPALPHLRGT
jgi:hypothetical protein